MSIWSVQLDPMTSQADGVNFENFTIKAMLEDGLIRLKDVLFGDVWVCSGQSNMKFVVNRVSHSTLSAGLISQGVQPEQRQQLNITGSG